MESAATPSGRGDSHSPSGPLLYPSQKEASVSLIPCCSGVLIQTTKTLSDDLPRVGTSGYLANVEGRAGHRMLVLINFCASFDGFL